MLKELAAVGADGLPRRQGGLLTMNVEAVASLSTCHINMDASCDWHATRKAAQYLDEWMHRAAPKHCRPSNAPPASLVRIAPDRLGMDADVLCDR